MVGKRKEGREEGRSKGWRGGGGLLRVSEHGVGRWLRADGWTGTMARNLAGDFLGAHDVSKPTTTLKFVGSINYTESREGKYIYLAILFKHHRIRNRACLKNMNSSSLGIYISFNPLVFLLEANWALEVVTYEPR